MAVTIKVSPDELKNAANNMTNLLNKLEKEWRNIENVVKKTKGYWEGDASDVHQKHYTSVSKDALKVMKDLKERPDELLKMADLYDQSEKENVQLAQSLSSDVII